MFLDQMVEHILSPYFSLKTMQKLTQPHSALSTNWLSCLMTNQIHLWVQCVQTACFPMSCDTEAPKHHKTTPDRCADSCRNFKGRMIFFTYYHLRGVSEHAYVKKCNKKYFNNGQIIFWKCALPNGRYVIHDSKIQQTHPWQMSSFLQEFQR